MKRTLIYFALVLATQILVLATEANAANCSVHLSFESGRGPEFYLQGEYSATRSGYEDCIRDNSDALLGRARAWCANKPDYQLLRLVPRHRVSRGGALIFSEIFYSYCLHHR